MSREKIANMQRLYLAGFLDGLFDLPERVIYEPLGEQRDMEAMPLQRSYKQGRAVGTEAAATPQGSRISDTLKALVRQR